MSVLMVIGGKVSRAPVYRQKRPTDGRKADSRRPWRSFAGKLCRRGLPLAAIALSKQRAPVPPWGSTGATSRRGWLALVLRGFAVVAEGEQIEQVPEGRCVCRYIVAAGPRFRIGQVVAAAAADGRQVPVALDE